MSEILFQYHKINPTTWVYLSSLLMIGLYFKFGRLWSVRNLDLLLLILLAPGLLMAQYGGEARVKARRLSALEKLREIERQPYESSLAVEPQDADPDGEHFASDLELLLAVSEDLAGQLETDALEASSTPLADHVDAPDIPEASDSSEDSVDSEDRPLTLSERLLDHSKRIEKLGFLWLFAVGAFLLGRLLLDPTMVRRPLLDPNLTSGGLTFIGCSLFVFVMANVWTAQVSKISWEDIAAMEQVVAEGGEMESTGEPIRRGPGYALLKLIPSIPTAPMVPEGIVRNPGQERYVLVAKIIAIGCHLAVVLGIAAIGYWHFGNLRTGVGAATLYLMLPYTAQMTGANDHVIPAALLVWAVLCYRRPMTSGLFIGLATALVYYPLFLLPLWISFYLRRGLMRFALGVTSAIVVMAVLLAFVPEASYWDNLRQMFGLWLPHQEGLEGIWQLAWNPKYRVPVLAAFIALCLTLAIWPAQKNLGTLLSCSGAVMVATQFWHGFGGGLYIGWYLPLLLLTVFRPNLEDRVALAVLGEGWLPRRATAAARSIRAALF